MGRPCVPSLADVPEPVDLVVLGVPDKVLVEQLELAGTRGDGAAVIFGSAHGLGADIAAAANARRACAVRRRLHGIRQPGQGASGRSATTSTRISGPGRSR